MSDTKLREFWIADEFGNECASNCEAHQSYCFRIKPQNQIEKFIRVREVSPSLDAAWAECERALKETSCTCPLISKYDSSNCKRCDALAALKKARGEK